MDIGAYQTQTAQVVNTAGDATGGAEPAGLLSLRQAITLANAGLGVNTITFAPSLAGSASCWRGATCLRSDQHDDHGLGASSLTVSGHDQSRVFDVAKGVTATISGLTISGGSATSGGGVYNSGTLTLTNDTLSYNSATSDGGGASTMPAR